MRRFGAQRRNKKAEFTMDGNGRAPRGVKARKADRLSALLERAGAETRLIASRLGFPFFHLVFRMVAPPGLPLQFFIDGGPQGFRELYDGSIGYERDPVLRRALSTLLPFGLRDALTEGEAPGQAALAQLARLGIHDGIIVPLHGPNAAHGMLTLLGPDALAAPGPPREELFRQAQWASLNLFSDAAAGIAQAHASNLRSQLTARQRKALSLAASGKVLTEIATHLRVHPSTARYLVARAAEKLGVETRAEAIVRMAATGDFFHSLFPGTIDGSSIYFPAPRAA
jgi:LuxR family transcriptional regulator, quorum-sensing system regulator SolR